MRVPRWFLALPLVLAGPSFAQTDAPLLQVDDAIVQRGAQLRLTGERLELPADGSIGLVGVSYLLQLAPRSAPWLYGGPAAYGAVSGRRGGLLVVGGEAAARLPIHERWSIGAGLFAGGAAVGDGLMLRPHAELLWEFRPGQRLGLGWSQVRFASSRIDSSQVALTWQIDTRFGYLPEGGSMKFLQLGTSATPRTGVGFDRVQATAGVYRPHAGARTLAGAPLPRNLGFAGARLERSIGDNLYWGVEANGAASGGVGGYAELLGTMGYEVVTDSEAFAAGYRLALGSAGGGGVDTGGGLLWKAGVYGIARLASDLGLTLEGGLARAPQGSFRARYASVALNWIIDDRLDGTAPPRVTPMEWAAGVGRYRAVRKPGSAVGPGERALDYAKLRVNREMAPGFYLGGEVQSAVGGSAGGYVVGLVGAGLRRDFGERLHGGVELFGGAAGGGGVDAGGGAVVQPMAYLGWQLAPGLALRVGGGHVKSLRGPLSSSVGEVSLVFGFGVVSRGYR
ncbi:MAG TPA: hypothetical protein VFR90_16160 [Methylibium sp.]|uniref:hypothetical protein n=1 Tax=Methylibium sp. TaxID=2067992 RepID=UPI002DBAFFB5|nr:hypothetical protein [Methylibium sp.]HEU4460655.1 hypothetical protein [Methylibium sp.]